MIDDTKMTLFVINQSCLCFLFDILSYSGQNVWNMSPALEPLANIRGQLGLTQHDLADKLGISRPHLSKLENSQRPLSPKLTRRVAEVCRNLGLSNGGSLSGIRAIPVRSWAQAGTGGDFDELPLDWQKRVATDCPDEQAFAVEIQGDSMEPKFFPGDIAVLMPTRQPRNGSLVVARLDREGVVFKVFTARDKSPVRICSFTSYNPVFQPIEVSESSVIWNYPVYQIIRQVWR
jgi:phage repressor protein C with HTH and peptisase S24 domain